MAEAVFLVANVVTVKFADVAPAGTSTLAGTLANVVFDEDSNTTTPAAGAAWVSVTVPVEDAPPTTLPGLSARVDSVAEGTGFTVSAVVLVTPP